MKPIGFWWSDHEHGDDQYPKVEQFIVKSYKHSDRDIVIKYLKSGKHHASYLGMSECRICGEFNGCSEYTDGTYFWPEGLIHYIEKHNVRIPELDKHIREVLSDRLEKLATGVNK